MDTLVTKTLNILKPYEVYAPNGEINAYTYANTAGKEAFHRDGKLYLKRLAECLKLTPEPFRGKPRFYPHSNPAGIGSTGEVNFRGFNAAEGCAALIELCNHWHGQKLALRVCQYEMIEWAKDPVVPLKWKEGNNNWFNPYDADSIHQLDNLIYGSIF